MHVHAGIIDFANVLAYMIIAGFFLRLISARWPDNPWSKALAFII
jgi:hypothetical protein